MAAERTNSPGPRRELPLAPVRVVDLAGSFGAYAGRLLADLGAQVIRVVPRSGDPLADHRPVISTPTGAASAFSWFVNLGKDIVALDLERPEDLAELAQLIGSADILLETWGAQPPAALGWSRAQLEARFPDLVIVSITPHGIHGPRGGQVGSDLTVLASGGLLALGGYPDSAPIAPNGDQAEFAGSIFGAVAAIFGLIARQADGRGRLLDVSAEEAVVAALEDAIPQFDLTGQTRRRAGELPREAGTGIYACADGHVSMVAGRLGTARAWRSLIDWLVSEGVEGAEELQGDDWQSFPYRQRREAIATFSRIFGPFAKTRTMDQLYADAQQRSIALAPVNEVPGVLGNAQLEARGFFVEIAVPELGRRIRYPGRPYRLSEDEPYNPTLSSSPEPTSADLLHGDVGSGLADTPALSRRAPG